MLWADSADTIRFYVPVNLLPADYSHAPQWSGLDALRPYRRQLLRPYHVLAFANGALEMAPLPHIPFERSRKAKTIFCGLEKAGLESVIRCIPRSGLVQFPKCRVEQNAE
jgi:hypothetical protein